VIDCDGVELVSEGRGRFLAHSFCSGTQVPDHLEPRSFYSPSF